jgi:hypothetical protein
MAKLPRTEDLPRAEDGLDPARVEEAFASFAERVRELETVAGELRSELRELRNQRSEARAPAPEDWPEDASFAPSPDWVASVPPPLVRPFAVPRLAIEALFLLAVALLAGLADLSALWIVLVMAAAWALVALSEWSAAATRARWRLDEIAPSLDAPPPKDETTGPWSMPVVEATAIARADGSESHTVIATLPAEPEDAAENGAEPAPEAAGDPTPRRGLRRWRRKPAEPAADPWEA